QPRLLQRQRSPPWRWWQWPARLAGRPAITAWCETGVPQCPSAPAGLPSAQTWESLTGYGWWPLHTKYHTSGQRPWGQRRTNRPEKRAGSAQKPQACPEKSAGTEQGTSVRRSINSWAHLDVSSVLFFDRTAQAMGQQLQGKGDQANGNAGVEGPHHRRPGANHFDFVQLPGHPGFLYPDFAQDGKQRKQHQQVQEHVRHTGQGLGQ